MATISFVIAYKKVENVQINQLFQLLNLICAYGDVFCGLTRMQMSKKCRQWRHLKIRLYKPHNYSVYVLLQHIHYWYNDV